MKELKSMVEQDDAKKMGYAEYNIFKKLRALFRKRGKKSDDVFKNLKTLLKDGWEGKKTLDNLAKASDKKDDDKDKKDDDKKDDDKKEVKKDSNKKKSSSKKDKKKKKK
uniref:Uncharacterized protein n=1 Tax=Favella ehrenbergii TaxID=182087 RepID=A0A7S3I7L3_9SPIT|mmetsp:Transcript_8130/g.9755  ORF Transcript_8130/g.9755 Transcript_8130/m.9755 type:complete len:109 (+) Transcript_8130:253-579(+)